ncbi:helix-hairpin-helix domain-containing protein [Guptibacillus algicola]|uniref:helix-hairpin-helix domain-containing protein n=1 Tax=Guptibacillus algicola TaxID=225844 RepID=UPI001CD62D3E|nr:helix-hairpin-helix domain-containing protein [Alkalihalobacillus algicola]MCA0986113.1 helix-hairpin-helix domain-containing protein [Alkalihalobacillus algicola]
MELLKSLSSREKAIAGVSLLTIAVCLCVIYLSSEKVENDFLIEEAVVEEEENGNEEVREKEPEYIMVDVKGAVVKPGVYELKSDARVKDIITRAGGFLEEADQTQLNLAGKVVDEMMIYVPVIGEGAGGSELSSVEANSGLISINKATLSELQELPGIGPAKAEAIIAYREEQGGFSTIDDLKEISGIGEKTFEKLKDLITVQ